MEVGLVHRVDIEHEMQQSYLDYAMSVIVSRALPDARDGLKPVQRRILYAMYDMGLRPDSSYKKSARIVGEVLGKYHPHGDLAVYEAMARMAQDFSMRASLVDGQGNFGSIDGDPPAAMRYTEARLTPQALEILSQLDRDTVNFSNNFDETLREPDVLPAAIPNLLVNGGSGIAVGMATSIPPHNLAEVIDALTFMLTRWEGLDDVNVTDLMQFIKGPDFPTGGIILQESDKDDITSAYATGRGRVVLRGRVHLEEAGRGRSRIIITELPYQTNKSSLMERIAALAREEEIDGIADLRDESDRQGMRIVIELNKSTGHENVLRELYRRTSLQSTFRISLLALVENEPRLLSLKQALRVYLEHRLTVIKRRSQFDLARARARAHILEGLRIALKFLDEVIALIRKAPDADTAKQRLMKAYKLDEVQAQAILDLALRRLASLERKKIEDEYKDLKQTIHDLEALLASPKKMRLVVQTELASMKELYGDKRRTQIVHLNEGEVAHNLLTTSDVMPGQNMWVTVTAEGLIGRIPGDLPAITGREAPRWAFTSNTHHTLYLVNQDGRAAAIPVHALPEISSFSSGVPYHRISPFGEGNGLAAVFSVPPSAEIQDERYVLTVTRKGLVKKSAVTELPGPSSQLFTMARVNEGDQLGWALMTTGNDHVFMATSSGMAIRFVESEVRSMGLVAAGVNGIKLNANDEVIGAEIVSEKSEIMLLSSQGKSWRMIADNFPLQGRYGQGVIAARMQKGSWLVGSLSGNSSQTGIVSIGQLSKRVAIRDAAVVRRATGGTDLITVKANVHIDQVSSVTDLLAFWKPELAIKSAATPRKRAVVPKPAQQLELLESTTVESKKSSPPKAKPAVKHTAAPKELPSAAKPLAQKKTAAVRASKTTTVSADKTSKTTKSTTMTRVAGKKADSGKTTATKPVVKKPASSKPASGSSTTANKPDSKKPAVKQPPKKTK